MSVSLRPNDQAERQDTSARAVDRTSSSPAADPVRPLTRDFLGWLASGPRPYADVMEAWRTSCPRLSIWEDALSEGLVRVERGAVDAEGQPVVALTRAGRAVLEEFRPEVDRGVSGLAGDA